ncbi:MAG TPA: glycosyltransferase family 4 protein [Terriglobales bacterium]|nr:glycosyltransferase family 4 protein [Terriglobales bacterium]
MKALVLTPSLVRAGGIERYTVSLIVALKDLLGEQNVRSMTIPERVNSNRRGRLSPGLKLCFGWQAIEEAVRSKPDLIICTHLGLGPVGWLLATFRQRPYWIVAYGIEAWGLLPSGKRIALQQADRVVVISSLTRQQLVSRHGIHRERISTLPCCLDESLLGFTEEAGDGLHPYFADDRRVLLTVGRLASWERYKGHDVILHALPSVLTKIRNLTYAVVGDGDDRVRLERLAQRLGIAQQVVFTGEVSDRELAAIYRRSEIFALPARTVIDDRTPKGEGFGIVFLEAMAFGKPVIGPNYGAPAELIRDGENGLLVDPEDHTSVTEALLKLLTNPGEASKMGRAGRDWVESHYSYGSFRERLREELRSAVDA